MLLFHDYKHFYKNSGKVGVADRKHDYLANQTLEGGAMSELHSTLSPDWLESKRETHTAGVDNKLMKGTDIQKGSGT